MNVNLEPQNDHIAYIDATQKFPFPENVFTFIYSVLMIEHISLVQAEFMIAECYRTFKPGGVLRLSTPNIGFLIELYKNPLSDQHKRYIEFSKRYFKSVTKIFNETVVINNFFRDWGHQFIHYAGSLTDLLKNAGFKDIKTRSVNISEYPKLSNLEHHQLELTEEFNILESVLIEGNK